MMNDKLRIAPMVETLASGYVIKVNLLAVKRNIAPIMNV